MNIGPFRFHYIYFQAKWASLIWLWKNQFGTYAYEKQFGSNTKFNDEFLGPFSIFGNDEPFTGKSEQLGPTKIVSDMFLEELEPEDYFENFKYDERPIWWSICHKWNSFWDDPIYDIEPDEIRVQFFIRVGSDEVISFYDTKYEDVLVSEHPYPEP